MSPDGELLRRYTESRSEEAFAELVRRHVDLVYSAALRQVGGDDGLAQDVAQTVFTDLARKAAALGRRELLSGWLYTSTHFAAAKAVRTERRRHAREQEAYAMNELLRNSASDADWEQLRPLLDTVMLELSAPDREAILLRFFEQRPLAAVGERLGLSEDAARKRVERALDKLRSLFARRGITTTATLAAVLSAHAVQVAPAGLAAALTGAALTGASAGAATSFTILKLMGMTKVQLGVGAAVLAAVTTALIVQHSSQAGLQRENEFLRRQNAQLASDNDYFSNHLAQARARVPQLPALPVLAAAPNSASVPAAVQSTNLYERLKDKDAKLTTAQLESYLKANRRNAASLLAAYRTSGDPALLEEAMQKYPNDPQVAFEAVFKKEGPPEERRQWVDAFKKSDPNNALPNYLSALEYFRSGQSDQAVQEFAAAAGKSFQDYTRERCQDDAEAYQAAGYSVLDATTVSSMQLLLPQLKQVKELGLDMIELGKAYRQAGDNSSAQAALQMAIDLGQRYGGSSPGEPEISQLVGMAVERIALGAMDPNSPYGGAGQTVQDRMNQLTQQNNELKELANQVEPLFPRMSDQDWLNYKQSWLVFGEVNALHWLINKYRTSE